MKRILRGPRVGILWLLLVFSPFAKAETVIIEADRDTTLIESPDGALANGSGPTFFVGRTGQTQNGVRRGLVHFDVGAVLPERAVVLSAALTLYASPSHPAVQTIRLHRLLADWGEGASYATGGGGDDSAPGDATWIHTFYDENFWIMRGGHFVRRVSALQNVGDAGFYSWEGSRQLARDVRRWHSAPHRNFGWILIGDETAIRTVKTFASREEPDPSLRPVLEITYRLPRR